MPPSAISLSIVYGPIVLPSETTTASGSASTTDRAYETAGRSRKSIDLSANPISDRTSRRTCSEMLGDARRSRLPASSSSMTSSRTSLTEDQSLLLACEIAGFPPDQVCGKKSENRSTNLNLILAEARALPRPIRGRPCAR